MRSYGQLAPIWEANMEAANVAGEAKAQAILVTEKGVTKVYRDGSDWHAVGPTGEVRFFSVWNGDVIGSLKRAVQSVVESAGDSFSEENILYPCVSRGLSHTTL